MKYLAILFLLISVLCCYGIDETLLASRLYTSERAWRVGDLLTVVVSEQVTSKKEESTTTSRDTQASGKASLGDPNGGRLSRELARVDIPNYSIDNSSGFTGSGAAISAEEFSTRFTVRVVDVLPNGILVIRGEREMTIRKEYVKVVLTGMVRRRDIDTSNKINSNQIADAYISYESDGQVSRDARPGWLWKIFQTVNPF